MPSFIKGSMIWTGALFMAYMFLLSGLHKWVWKIRETELSRDIYHSLDRFYQTAVSNGYRELERFSKLYLKDTLPLPRLSAQTVKKTVGGVELVLSVLWLTSAWRTAAMLSIPVLLSWLLVTTLSDDAGDSVALATTCLCLALFLLYLGREPERARPKAPVAKPMPRRAEGQAGASQAK